MIDIALGNAILQVLANNADRGPITTEVLCLDLEAMLRRPAIMHRVQAMLAHCKRQGWLDESADEWGEPVYSLTHAGMEKNARP